LVRERSEITAIQHESEAYKFGLDNVVMNIGTLDRFKRDVLFAVQSF
jgi:hypothetical protein